MPWHFQNMVVGGLRLPVPATRTPMALDIFCQNYECSYLTPAEVPSQLATGEVFLVLWRVVLREEVGTLATRQFQPATFACAVPEARAHELARRPLPKPQYTPTAAELAFLHRHFHESTPWARAQPLEWLHLGLLNNSWE